MKPITRAIRALSLGIALAAVHCGSPTGPLSRGGGSDTETLTGLVSLESGAPAARVQVKLLPSDYDPSHPGPDSLRIAMTDDSGRFKFDKLDSLAYYNVIAGKRGERSWALAESLRTGPGRKAISLARSRIFMVSLEYYPYEKNDSGIAFFPGTDILVRCDGKNVYKLDSVPAQANHVIVQSNAGWRHDSTFVLVQDSVDLKADVDGITCLQ
jgi:hypothetical protein